MECEEIKRKISMYFEERLSELDVKYVKEHIKICENCRLEFKEMEILFDILSNHETVYPPIDFTDKVINIIKKKNQSISLEKWGKSLIAAGIILALLNFASIGNIVDEISLYAYKSSLTITEKVSQPVIEISNSIKNLKGFIK
ncbi:zf-HC2 domain-containing protein [Thermohalobacter berrensis]|uniref:Putative zinc-finger domain-containing protein n=1 Tax=Thermohalobacter berrensis TaxID=99594 RepID=A0A419T4V0_9FIRM|nr:zf-HC2 domain-containing protein [Thermohalobacter berrensis]RKD32564.1 hypothetical protein BET03_10840 [Thermohalobacter berrensis]